MKLIKMLSCIFLRQLEIPFCVNHKNQFPKLILVSVRRLFPILTMLVYPKEGILFLSMDKNTYFNCLQGNPLFQSRQNIQAILKFLGPIDLNQHPTVTFENSPSFLLRIKLPHIPHYKFIQSINLFVFLSK